MAASASTPPHDQGCDPHRPNEPKGISGRPQDEDGRNHAAERTDDHPCQRRNGFRRFLVELGFGQSDLCPDDFLNVTNDVLSRYCFTRAFAR